MHQHQAADVVDHVIFSPVGWRGQRSSGAGSGRISPGAILVTTQGSRGFDQVQPVEE